MSAVPADRFRDEVLDLHGFLDAWLKGEVARGADGPVRLARVLAEDFVVIHPDGSRSGRAAVVAAFDAAHASKPGAYALQVGRIDTRMIATDLCLATYQEWHRGEPGRARISTAILRSRPDRDEIDWLFLQETPAPWLEPGPRRPARD